MGGHGALRLARLPVAPRASSSACAQRRPRVLGGDPRGGRGDGVDAALRPRGAALGTGGAAMPRRRRSFWGVLPHTLPVIVPDVRGALRAALRADAGATDPSSSRSTSTNTTAPPVARPRDGLGRRAASTPSPGSARGLSRSRLDRTVQGEWRRTPCSARRRRGPAVVGAAAGAGRGAERELVRQFRALAAKWLVVAPAASHSWGTAATTPPARPSPSPTGCARRCWTRRGTTSRPCATASARATNACYAVGRRVLFCFFFLRPCGTRHRREPRLISPHTQVREAPRTSSASRRGARRRRRGREAQETGDGLRLAAARVARGQGVHRRALIDAAIDGCADEAGPPGPGGSERRDAHGLARAALGCGEYVRRPPDAGRVARQVAVAPRGRRRAGAYRRRARLFGRLGRAHQGRPGSEAICSATTRRRCATPRPARSASWRSLPRLRKGRSARRSSTGRRRRCPYGARRSARRPRSSTSRARSGSAPSRRSGRASWPIRTTCRACPRVTGGAGPPLRNPRRRTAACETRGRNQTQNSSATFAEFKRTHTLRDRGRAFSAEQGE